MRICNVNLSEKKRIIIALCSIKGIGRSKAKLILDTLNIAYDVTLANLKQEKITALNVFIEKNIIIESQLKQEVKNNIAEEKRLNTYKGRRHSFFLPVKGQRTRRNAKTAKKRRKKYK